MGREADDAGEVDDADREEQAVAEGVDRASRRPAVAWAVLRDDGAEIDQRQASASRSTVSTSAAAWGRARRRSPRGTGGGRGRRGARRTRRRSSPVAGAVERPRSGPRPRPRPPISTARYAPGAPWSVKRLTQLGWSTQAWNVRQGTRGERTLRIGPDAGLADLPARPDHGPGDVDPVGGEVLPEQARWDVATDLLRPPLCVLAGVRVDRLVGATVVLDVDLDVSRGAEECHGVRAPSTGRLSMAVRSRSPPRSGISACTTQTASRRPQGSALTGHDPTSRRPPARTRRWARSMRPGPTVVSCSGVYLATPTLTMRNWSWFQPPMMLIVVPVFGTSTPFQPGW